MAGMGRGEAYKILREISYIQQTEKRKKKQAKKNQSYTYAHKDETVPKKDIERTLYTIVWALIVVFFGILLISAVK